jgi:hypothetical protein
MVISRGFIAKERLIVVDDLRFQQREDVCGKRCRVISGSIYRLPNAFVGWRLDWTQDKLRHECGVLGAAGCASSCNFAPPDENMELAECGVFGGVNKP